MIVRRSPTRETSSAAGPFISRPPTPISTTTAAANAGAAPKSRAAVATAGIIAPRPIA